MLVHHLVKQGQPDTLALQDKHDQFTYGQFQMMVDCYRNYFYAQGVRPGVNVGILSKNSPEFIFSYFAITSLGAVVVPLNFMLSPREIAYIIRDAKIKTIITMRALDFTTEDGVSDVSQLIIPEFAPTVTELKLAQAPVTDDFADDQGCVILYTSGTTGHPKGAVLTHRNLISDAQAFAEMITPTPADNFLCVLPMFHSFAWTCAVLTPLLGGAAVTIMESFTPKDAISTIRNQGLTVVCGVPAMYNFYASIGTPEDFANVRLFVSGGASLPQEILNKFFEKTGKHIMEGYGLSEASPVVTMNPLERGKAGSIGKPIPGVAIKIVDAAGKELPAGEIGELITRGPNVMKEYFNLPEATRETIRDNWLHTSDLAYQDEEGYIFIVDRLKDLVIVGGLNVYPREIEEVLYKYPAVAEAAVIGVPDKVRGESICAFIVLKEGETFNKKALMAYLHDHLAAYKIPREVVQIEALPKNATGKILKKVLREEYVKA